MAGHVEDGSEARRKRSSGNYKGQRRIFLPGGGTYRDCVQKTVRLRPCDMAGLEAIQEAYGLPSLVDAIRHAITTAVTADRLRLRKEWEVERDRHEETVRLLRRRWRQS